MGLAVVTRIPSLVEAQIAAGALRSAGIDAQVFDAAFGTIESPVIESLGGFRIMAPEADAAEARAILQTLRSGPGLGEPGEDGPWTPATPTAGAGFRARGMKLAAAVLLAVPLLLWLILRLVR